MDPATLLANQSRLLDTPLWDRYFVLVAEARALYAELDTLQGTVDAAEFFGLVRRAVEKGREIDALVGSFVDLCRVPEGPAN